MQSDPNSQPLSSQFPSTVTQTVNSEPLTPPTREHSKDSKGHWLVRLLYNNNPFYLVSGGLILFGLSCYSESNLESAVDFSELSESATLSTAGILAGYVVLLAVTVIFVVRVAKVWEDARTIFLVLVLSMLRLSVFFDQLCTTNWRLAYTLLFSGFLFSIIVAESTLALTKLRLKYFFKLPVYFAFALFFSAPIFLSIDFGPSDYLDTYRVTFFPAAMGIVSLTFIPAIRKGRAAFNGNGSPWNWPLYPWSLGVILIVAVVFRASTLAVSFGPSADTGLILNPVFLLPFLFCITLLLIETSVIENLPALRRLVFCLLWGSLFMTPFAKDIHWQLDSIQMIEQTIGSMSAICGWLVAVLFLYFYFRGIRSARFMAALCIAVVSFETAASPLIQPTPFAIAAITSIPILIELANAIVDRTKTSNWISVGLFTAFWSFAVSNHILGTQEAVIVASIVFAAFCMSVGLIFDDEVSQFFRATAAFEGGIAAMITTSLLLTERLNETLGTLSIGSLLLATFCYWLLVKRRGWLRLTIGNAILFFVCMGHCLQEGIIAAFDGKYAFAITGGSGCFLIAVLITTAKAGMVRHAWNALSQGRARSTMPGF